MEAGRSAAPARAGEPSRGRGYLRGKGAGIVKWILLGILLLLGFLLLLLRLRLRIHLALRDEGITLSWPRTAWHSVERAAGGSSPRSTARVASNSIRRMVMMAASEPTRSSSTGHPILNAVASSLCSLMPSSRNSPLCRTRPFIPSGRRFPWRRLSGSAGLWARGRNWTVRSRRRKI